MKAEYILSADDYGPISFINVGIRKAVQAGIINSVQVLVNFDEDSLYNELLLLNKSVPNDKIISIGLHLTITSGKPLYCEVGKTIHETWGLFVVKNNAGKYCFRDYQYFYFPDKTDSNYSVYSNALNEEFKAQVNRLKKVISKIESNGNTLKMTFNSLSNHHDLCTASIDLFERYIRLSKSEGLAIRSPKVKPYLRSFFYYRYALFFKNYFKRRKFRREAKFLSINFSINNYMGDHNINLKSPSYIDAKFYRALGSFSVALLFHKKKINKRIKLVGEIIKNANNYSLHSKTTPKRKIVEVLFHLGDDTYKGKYNQGLTNGYKGIKWKYFEDRSIELKALLEIKKRNNWDAFFEKGGELWDECSTVTYLKKWH